MSVIDERGDLFGVVNVVDAFSIALLACTAGGALAAALGSDGGRLVIGLVVLVLIGGIGVVSREESPAPFEGRETTHAIVLDLRRTWTGRVCWYVTDVLVRRPISRVGSSTAGRVIRATISHARGEIIVVLCLLVLSATVTALSLRGLFGPPSTTQLVGHFALASLAVLGLASQRYRRGLLERVVKDRFGRWFEPPNPPTSFSDPSPRPTDEGRDAR